MILWFGKKKKKDDVTGETPIEPRPAEDAATANTAQDVAEKKGLFGGLFGGKTDAPASETASQTEPVLEPDADGETEAAPHEDQPAAPSVDPVSH